MAEEQKARKFRPLRSLTRLLVGGILLGSELLENQLQTWDGSPEESDAVRIKGDFQAPLDVESLPETLPAPQVGVTNRRSNTDVRYALIGLIFEGEEKLEDMLDAAKRIGSRADKVLDPLIRPIQKLGAKPPVRKNFDQLTSRGQSAIDRWISRGQEEESHSRQLTQAATTSTVDQSILYMAENEAITELIQTQGVSFAEQILELVRAISVSIDYFSEGLIRYVLRRSPRYLMPPPSQEVQEQASWMVQDIRQEDM